MARILEDYNKEALTVATLGSHSALDIAKGAHDEGFQTLVVGQDGREGPYQKYRHDCDENDFCRGCINHVEVLDKFTDMATPEFVEGLQTRNAIFVPHRSFSVYVAHKIGYDAVMDMEVPFFGNRALLQAEERGPLAPKLNQDALLELADIPRPRTFASPDEIDMTAIVKVSKGHGDRAFERSFFYARNKEEFWQKGSKLVGEGKTTREQLKDAHMEEYVHSVREDALGNVLEVPAPKYNFNFFNSPFHGLELLGIDTRVQASNGEELAHHPGSLKESLLSQVFDLGERFVNVAKKHAAPGVIGPFALQAIFKGEKALVYDASLRMPGSPDTEFTPYSGYLFGKPVSFGRRIAMEIREAAGRDELLEVVT